MQTPMDKLLALVLLALGLTAVAVANAAAQLDPKVAIVVIYSALDGWFAGFSLGIYYAIWLRRKKRKTQVVGVN